MSLPAHFDPIIETLETIAEGSDKPKAIEATGLLHQIYNYKFVSCLIIFLQILGFTKSLSDQLQNKEIYMVLAAQLVVSTSETLQSI